MKSKEEKNNNEPSHRPLGRDYNHGGSVVKAFENYHVEALKGATFFKSSGLSVDVYSDQAYIDLTPIKKILETPTSRSHKMATALMYIGLKGLLHAVDSGLVGIESKNLIGYTYYNEACVALRFGFRVIVYSKDPNDGEICNTLDELEKLYRKKMPKINGVNTYEELQKYYTKLSRKLLPKDSPELKLFEELEKFLLLRFQLIGNIQGIRTAVQQFQENISNNLS